MTAVVELLAPPLALSSAEKASQVRREVRALSAKVIASSDLLDDIESMTAEGIANAVLHGTPAITVTVTADDARLRVSVQDRGPARKGGCLGQITTDRIDYGRGLTIIEAYAAAWSLITERKRTCLWFEVDLDGCPTDMEAQTSPWPALPLGGESSAGGGKFPTPPALGSTPEDQ
ncbi:ATP-binding protein [Spirillospora sp. NPDC048911]|uniref:ATP-binding protein n=1 Tax=Spirillospora sp. NPDC048911 TaxID=3364527 RepID=UPI00370FE82F